MMNGSTMRHLCNGAIVFTIAFLSFAVTGLANAASWGPRTSYYNNIARVKGSGTFTNDAGTAKSSVTTTDMSNDGNTVYASTQFYAWRYNSIDGSSGFVSIGVRSTAPFSNATKLQTVTRSYANEVQGTSMRGQVQSCAQMGWPIPNSCTTPAVLTVSY